MDAVTAALLKVVFIVVGVLEYIACMHTSKQSMHGSATVTSQ